ncbi:putative nuclease HARBI1 [Xyrichtys novacula]|uniref:Putative nuclease HARBI1 n=1 Tax=Xyrichtys novacula TaxID=13765 RepID=A0AAV1FLT6_XYRNO|nr:putative nuclease HARBI1 [Xyrichtys novacula]
MFQDKSSAGIKDRPLTNRFSWKMACPLLPDRVDAVARIVRGALRRERYFRDRCNPFDLPDDILYERYRFSFEGLLYLSELLEPYVANVTHRSRALTVPQTVCLALRFFATGTFMYAVGDAENLSKNTCCKAIHKMARALSDLLDKFVIFPGHLALHAIKEGFYALAGFRRVMGAIDCTHIPITASLGPNEADYVNRKNFHSINTQMTCDHQMMVTSLEAKWPGSVHDSQIFRESQLCRKLEQGLFSGVLLGDRGYACQPYLLTPYPDPGAGPQTLFNVALAKTRVRIEMTFGVIKARFNCLRGLRMAPERACRVIAACVVLHNIAAIQRERVPPVDTPPP